MKGLLTAEQLKLLSEKDPIVKAMLGTRGGRAIPYSVEGKVGVSITPIEHVDCKSVDHSKEELVTTKVVSGLPLGHHTIKIKHESVEPKVNWREFGEGRSDDFTEVTFFGTGLDISHKSDSTVRSFTLDDGVTTLTLDTEGKLKKKKRKVKRDIQPDPWFQNLLDKI